ncbi:hypothetical protein HYZ98_03205 [Candidatus Peregrinibacteria bacterium]|nr:hypothetical protein [Candidatus Peregrinibacteria bacterium]
MLDQFLFRAHLDDEEEIRAIIHKHWLLGVRALFWPTVSFFASWAILYYVPFRMMFYIIALWGMISLVWWLRNFFDYYLDAWIITDQGVLDLEWHGWFHRQVTRILYSDIQGVSYEVQGVLGTLMNFGLVSIEKISTDAIVEMDAVKHPKVITRIILKNMEEYLHGKNLKDARHVQELLAEVIANQVQLEDAENRLDEEEEEEEVLQNEDS